MTVDSWASRTGILLPELLTVRGVAASLNVSQQTVWQLAVAGDFPDLIRIWGSPYWRRADIEAWARGGQPR